MFVYALVTLHLPYLDPFDWNLYKFLSINFISICRTSLGHKKIAIQERGAIVNVPYYTILDILAPDTPIHFRTIVTLLEIITQGMRRRDKLNHHLDLFLQIRDLSFILINLCQHKDLRVVDQCPVTLLEIMHDVVDLPIKDLHIRLHVIIKFFQ